MRELDGLFQALQRSAFRRRFRLGAADMAYLRDKGLPEVLVHAQRFIDVRLAPAMPRNDGRQTPFRGHPVFVAQHATATCCRGCLEKWHRIPRGRALGEAEQDYVKTVLERWLSKQLQQADGGKAEAHCQDPYTRLLF